MSRLTAALTQPRPALISYITGGDPDFSTTQNLLEILDEAGTDVLEVGIPFSDPLADGPAIQNAAHRALRGGATLRGLLETLQNIRSRPRAPIVLMGYYNPLRAYGVDRFLDDARNAGVAGLIVPDLPWHEACSLAERASDRGIDFITMVTPNTPEERLIQLAPGSRGFLYCVSLLGVTGQDTQFSEDIKGYLQRVRQHTSLPLALGFGIDSPEKALMAGSLADGVVVGSAFVRLVERYGSQKPALQTAVRCLATALRQTLDKISRR